jgi:hypothetical protein
VRSRGAVARVLGFISVNDEMNLFERHESPFTRMFMQEVLPCGKAVAGVFVLEAGTILFAITHRRR